MRNWTCQNYNFATFDGPPNWTGYEKLAKTINEIKNTNTQIQRYMDPKKQSHQPRISNAWSFFKHLFVCVFLSASFKHLICPESRFWTFSLMCPFNSFFACISIDRFIDAFAYCFLFAISSWNYSCVYLCWDLSICFLVWLLFFYSLICFFFFFGRDEGGWRKGMGMVYLSEVLKKSKLSEIFVFARNFDNKLW